MIKTTAETVRELLSNNGYSYTERISPYDFFSDGRNRIGICLTCGIINLNGRRIPTRNFTGVLNDFFNGKIEA